jgi:hypothetical protein
VSSDRPPIKIAVTSGHRRSVPGDLPGEALFPGKPDHPVEIAATHRSLAA